MAVEDVKKTISENSDVITFTEKYNKAFGNFEIVLQDKLIENWQNIDISKEETAIANDIFSRLKDIPLIDKYNAYQLFNDDWEIVAADLEILQTEGFDSTKKVDPVMVAKKEKGKDVEVQDGWAGRIIPFSLVQQTLLKAESQNLSNKESRLTEIVSEYDEIIEALSEDDKESYTDCFNEEKTAFVTAAISKTAKNLQKSC